ncbi:MAG: hypothetical protein WC523_02735 [Patescibacteria group bacterium]
MKKAVIVLLVAIGMMVAFFPELKAQRLDVSVENGIGNIGQGNEFNYLILGLDATPFKLGYGPNFIGLDLKVFRSPFKDEANYFTGRTNGWEIGPSFNTKFGYQENNFLRIHLSYGQLTTRGSGSEGAYSDKQKDNFISGSVDFINWQEDNWFLCRHGISVYLRQPLSSTKEASWQGNPVDSTTLWDSQLIRGIFTETPVSFFLDHERDWKFNLNLSVGYGLEHKLTNNLPETLNYWTVGAGISIFKVPYFQQNIFQVGGEFQFMDHARFIFSAKLNLVPFLFWIWDKEELEIKLNE